MGGVRRNCYPGAKVADPLSSARAGREGAGGLHRLNPQGESQGLPPSRFFFLKKREGSGEGTGSLGFRHECFEDLKGLVKAPPAFLALFNLHIEKDKIMWFWLSFSDFLILPGV